MGHKVTFKIASKVHGENTLAVEFSDEEWQRLDSFATEADRLFQSVGAGLGVNFRIVYDAATGLTMELDKSMDQDRIALLLHRIRPFVLQNEPHTYFMNVVALLSQRVESEAFRMMLARQRELFDGRNFQSMIQIRSNDVAVNSETTLQNWLNSAEYHRDAERRKALERANFPQVLLTGSVQFLLIDKVRAILNVAH